jgi:ribose transport system substrate-binding protein
VVGLNGNVILEGAALGQGLASILNDKGSVLNVHGIPGVLSDSGIFQGVSDVFKNCPNIKTAGSVVGQFTPSVAKTATLEFLSAHPQPVDGAIHVGGMGLGILQAFTQTGRPVPTIADDGATPGLLAYWNAHKDTYKGLALGLPPGQIAQATWNLAEGLFAGRGLKISDISEPPIIITDKNLSQWLQPGWTVSTPIAYAPGPPGIAYPPSYLNQFFAKAAGK